MSAQKDKKVIIGIFTVVFILILITNSVFIYLLFVKENTNYETLNKKIDSVQTETQSKLNELSNNLVETKNELQKVGLQINSFDEEISLLKASVSSDFSGIVEQAIKSVVTIRTDASQGSGFFIADEGYIVTNAHVMENAKAAVIITYDGKSHTVYKIGEDSSMDIILLKINSTNYRPLKIADSDDVKQGQQIITIGNPYGLSFSVTQGIVSNVHQRGINGLNAYIQIDAALNPGNSGGPLIDREGKVIGINNFKLSKSEGMGFALESNYIKQVVNDIFNKTYGVNLI